MTLPKDLLLELRAIRIGIELLLQDSNVDLLEMAQNREATRLLNRPDKTILGPDAISYELSIDEIAFREEVERDEGRKI